MAKTTATDSPSEWLKLPDAELGYLLLAQFAAEQARVLGLPVSGMTAEYMERVRKHVLTRHANTAKDASLQLALHAVASGEPARAGRLYREHLMGAAIHGVYRKFTVEEQQRLKAARSKGGKATAQTRKDVSRISEIVAKAKEYKRVGKEISDRDYSGTIARALGMSPGYVRRVLVREGILQPAARKNRTKK